MFGWKKGESVGHKMSPVKRICVFEHSVMTNFNCACPAIQGGQGSCFLSEGSSWLTACMSEQRRFWRDCADAQARLNLRCSHRWYLPNSLDAVQIILNEFSYHISVTVINMTKEIRKNNKSDIYWMVDFPAILNISNSWKITIDFESRLFHQVWTKHAPFMIILCNDTYHVELLKAFVQAKNTILYAHVRLLHKVKW